MYSSHSYRGFFRNLSDGFLLANLIILFVGALRISEQYGFETEAAVQERQTIFSAAVVSVAYAVFSGVLLYHIFLRLPQRAQDKLINKIKQIRFAKEIHDFCQALENDVISPTISRELDEYNSIMQLNFDAKDDID